MDSFELRKKYLEFFEKRGHKVLPSASLIPENDPTVLFTTAGMQQFKPYYLGEKSPFGINVASCQKCIRTSDIEEVGDERHLTFFEMLGNFSFGGYFKKEAIKLAHEFIVKELKLKIDYVTVFKGNENVPEDKESFEIWEKIGVTDIKKEGVDNFWGPTGDEGPCGPTTEIYVNGIEIWNIVFNEYFCDKNKNLKKLVPAGVDTGMGLERLLVAVNNAENVYHTDLFEKPRKKLHELLEKEDPLSERIILDHIKAATFIIGDEKGVEPGNLGQGYIVRRLIRRAIRFGRKLGISKEDWTKEVAKAVIDLYEDAYPILKSKENFIFETLSKEEIKFEKTLESGIKALKKIFNLAIADVDPENLPKGSKIQENKVRVDGEVVFNIYQTYGLPIEISEEIMKEWGLEFDDRTIQEAKESFKKHQELSRTASIGMFKGGLADAGRQAIKYHTATHLLLASLRQVLGEKVFQKGSNITAERLRFDFSYPEKLTEEQIKKVEALVNEKIKENLKVGFKEMPISQAKEQGAMGVFGEKYGNIVKVYTIFNEETGEVFSKEICGGPHVDFTKELGYFKIIKEESSSSGVRRIKAVLN